MARTQLLIYGFGPDADFEGRLLGAFGRRGGGGRIVEPLLEFRLDPDARRRATRRALGDQAVELVARFLPNPTLGPGPEITPTG